MQHFCKLGMTTDGAGGDPAPAKKRTTVMTNSSNIAEVLRMAQCAKLHKHVPLEGGKAKACEVYPDKFVELICECVRQELDDVKLKNRMAEKFDICECIEKLMKLGKQKG